MNARKILELLRKAGPQGVSRANLMFQWPLSRQEIRAVELGADELIARAEWIFRSRPRALRNLRRANRHFCSFLLEQIERPA